MSNCCVTSELGTVRRANGIGTLELSNPKHINISDEGLRNVYVAYVAEILKAEQIKEHKNDL